MKSDARVRYTQGAIRRAFLRLLQEKPLAKVTVKDICQLAEINRATFYSHYHDIYDLLEQIEQEMLDHLTAELSSLEPGELEDVLTRLLYQIKEYGKLYSVVWSQNCDPGMIDRVVQICYIPFTQANRFECANLAPERLELVQSYLISGTGGAIAAWMRGRMECPEQTAKLLVQMGTGVIKYVLR